MTIYPKNGIVSLTMSNRISFNSRKISSEFDINFVEK